MKLRPIIVYDSGVGGLLVARRLMKYCPSHDLVYLADNGWFPYGNKDEKLLAGRVNEILSILGRRLRPAAIVVACNTASTAISQRLSRRGPVPIYGVIPPIGRAVRISAGGRVVLLATPGTLQRSVIRELIAKHNPLQISAIGSLDLVYMAEQKMADHSFRKRQVVDAVEALMPDRKRSEITTVVLGCTHFHILLPELREAFSNARYWLDPSTDVASAVQRDLSRHTVDERLPSYTLLLTSTGNSSELRRVFAAQGFPEGCPTEIDFAAKEAGE
jgi:glutamate racemase